MNVSYAGSQSVNTLAPRWIRGFSEKKLNTRGFAQEYLRSCTGYAPGWSIKRRGKASSLHSKKIFCLGVWFFVSDIISGGLLGQLGPLYLVLGTNR